MGITWASPTKRGGRLDDCRSASPTASVAKCAVSEATKERVHANDVHAHIRPWARENPVTRGVAKLNLLWIAPPRDSCSRVASGVAKLRARRAAGRQSGTNNTPRNEARNRIPFGALIPRNV